MIWLNMYNKYNLASQNFMNYTGNDFYCDIALQSKENLKIEFES